VNASPMSPLYRKIAWRIVPFLVILYMVAFLDRVNISFAALTAIHYAHRWMAAAVFVVLGLAAWHLKGGPLRRQAGWIAALMAWQFASGLSNVVLGWPLVAAVSHTAGAAALVAVLTWALCESRASAALARRAALGARELSA